MRSYRILMKQAPVAKLETDWRLNLFLFLPKSSEQEVLMG